MKLDRKKKEVNFLVQKHVKSEKAKANPDTIEGVIDKIDQLAFKLDQIQMNVVT